MSFQKFLFAMFLINTYTHLSFDLKAKIVFGILELTVFSTANSIKVSANTLHLSKLQFVNTAAPIILSLSRITSCQDSLTTHYLMRSGT
jgi:hypothetical protein